MRASAPVDRYGTPGGPLVILVHGAVANRKTWLPLARVISPAFELWCPDLPGHGSRRDEPFALRRALDDIDLLLAKARPRRAILAGDSLGGYLALAAAARNSRGIAAVVAGGCTWSMTGAAGWLARASDLPPALAIRLWGAERVERYAETLVPRAFDPETARAIVATGLRVASRSESLRELAGMDLVKIVREIRAPIAFVNGRYDWPTRAGEAELRRNAREAFVAISKRSGHGVSIFDPPLFAGAIVETARRARLAS